MVVNSETNKYTKIKVPDAYHYVHKISSSSLVCLIEMVCKSTQVQASPSLQQKFMTLIQGF